MPAIDLQQVSAVAQQYGPFFFALLFVLIVPTTAHKWYNDATKKKLPNNSEGIAIVAHQISTYRLYFVTSVVAGILFTIVAIIYYVWVHLFGNYVYQFAVLGLNDRQHLASNYYSLRTVRESPVPGALLQDLYFVAIQDHPFEPGQKFEIDFYETPSPSGVPQGGSVGVAVDPRRLEVTYGGNAQDSFTLEEGGGNPSLQKLAEASAPSPGFLQMASE